MRKTVRQAKSLKNKGSIKHRGTLKPVLEIHKWGKNARVIVRDDDGGEVDFVTAWDNVVEIERGH